MLSFNLTQAIEILEQTPKTLESFLSDLSENWIQCNEGDASWSAFDIVGHLIHGEKTDWITRLKIILAQSDHNTFQPFDRFAQFEASEGKTLQELLDEFSVLRAKNIKELQSLHITEDQFNLKAMHPELGEVTLSQLLATWVTHDLGHIAQIARVMAKQYKHEVGPWQAYIPIVNQ